MTFHDPSGEIVFLKGIRRKNKYNLQIRLTEIKKINDSFNFYALINAIPDKRRPEAEMDVSFSHVGFPLKKNQMIFSYRTTHNVSLLGTP